MLLTLTTSSLRRRLKGEPKSSGELELTDVPRFARDELGLYGLNISTDLLVGAGYDTLDRFRDAADKAQCPCLVLNEPAQLSLCGFDEDEGNEAIDRVTRVIKAANRLGCNSASIGIKGGADEDSFDNCVERLKQIQSSAERLEVNLLIATGPGITAEPDTLTELIKKVGGFRIGTFPDFQTASKSDDPIAFLKRLTPYASALTASTVEFKASGEEPVHTAYDLKEFVETVLAVGYQGTLAIDYRGKGSDVDGLLDSRRALEIALGIEVQEA